MHPWPTWSDFLWGGPGGTWNVQNAVPLKSIFFLAQAPEIHVEEATAPQTICQLVQAAQQVSWSLPNLFKIDQRDLRDIHLRQFDIACTLAAKLPAFQLQLNLTDPFWREIEAVLDPEN